MKTTILVLMVSMLFGSAVLAAARPMVGVYYFPGWYRAKMNPNDKVESGSEWRRHIMGVPKPRPLCGFYDDSDPRVWGYFCDWMADHGVDFIAFDWYYNDRETLLSPSLDKGFLQCDDRGKVKFALHWCNHPMGWTKPMDQSRDKLLDMVDYIGPRYLGQPNYLRIDGKPVFMVYDVDQLLSYNGREGLKSAIRAMKGRAQRLGYGGLYMVAVYSRVCASYVQLCRDLGFDAFCSYTYVGTRYPPLQPDSQNIPYELCVANCADTIYPFLSAKGREKGIAYWPTAFPGWDNRPRAGDRAFVTEGNTPERFGRMFRSALKYADSNPPVVMVEAWNEWGEGACIEPDQEYKFGYLDQIAAALGRRPAKPRLPSSEEIAAWNVLTPEEVAQAKAIEKQPYEPPKPLFLDFSKNRKTPAVKLPLTIDLAAGGAEVLVSGGRIEKRDAQGITFVSESIDPVVRVSLPEIPTTQIKRVTVVGETIATDSAAAVPIEVFFITPLYPYSSAFCSAQLGPLTPPQMSLETSDIMGWSSFGTPLTAIRVDPGDRPGQRVLLRRLIVE